MTDNNDTEELEELPDVTKRFYEEYDVELFYADKGTSGTFAVLERGECAYIEWTPFDSYDVNNHMSFDEWGVIAHDSTKEPSVGMPPLRVPISTIDSIKQEIGARGRACIIISTSSQRLPVIYFPKLDSVYRLVQCLKRFLCFIRERDTLVVDHSRAGLHKVMKELELDGTATSNQVYKKIAVDFQDVYDTTLSGLSKVTNFLRGSVVGKPVSRPGAQTSKTAVTNPTPPEHLCHRPAEGDFELYDLRKPLDRAAPVARDEMFTQALWETHFDSEGRVCRVKELQDRIFGGGCHPDLRQDVWPFLLNVYPWNSTLEERAAIMEQKKKEYEVLKNQWKSISPAQMKRFQLYRDREALVEKDVLRTDRVLEFYRGENNPHIADLYEMLMTYCQYNFDLGYVQGMSDLLSPLYLLFKDKLMAFWAFVGYMDMVEAHFFLDQQKIQGKLADLSSLVYYCDSELYNHLEKEDSSNFFFCFRWLLINFKREFRGDDILELWEVIWTCPYNTDYTLFIATAILLQERTPIIQKKMCFADILRYINDLSQHIDLREVLGNTESLFHNIRSQPDIPFNIRTNILRIAETPLSSLGSQYNPNRDIAEKTPEPETADHLITSRDLDESRDPASLLVENVSNMSLDPPQ
ncbi:hypothetical protein ACHWQZ_G012946 [Mnemiopsis leidyi]